MEEKHICPDAEADQQENETAPIDIESLPLLHLYRPQGALLFLPDEAVQELEENEAIESAAFDQDRERLSNEDTQPLTEPQVPQRRPAPNMGILVPALILLVNIGLVLSIGMFDIFTQTVTITIVPKTQILTTHLTLSPLQRRIFSPLTFTQVKTVPTTGHGYQPATQAQGTITFYNASEQAQTVGAGTLLTGSDGIQVVTDQTAYLPGSTPPTETQTIVTAHAVNPGVNGNIYAGDIKGSCCRINIFVYNAAFSRGQDARDYQTVTQADIHGVVSSLLPPLTQTMNTSFEKQVRDGETLVQPLCSQTITADHRVKQEAKTVTVTLAKTCRAGAYDTKSYTSQVIQTLEAQAGKGYRLTAYLPVSPVQTAITQRSIVLGATYQARVIYHFSSQELHTISTQIAGKNKAQALQLLQGVPGVAKVVLRLSGSQTSIPTDTEYIHVQVIEGNV